MQDVRPPSRGSIRPNIRPVLPVVRRVAPRHPTGNVIDFVKPVYYSASKPQRLNPVVVVNTQTSIRLAKTVNKAILADEVVRRSGKSKAKANKPKTHYIRNFFTHQSVLGIAVVLVLVATGYVSIDTWLTNRQARATFVDSSAAVQPDGSATTHIASEEGKDEQALPRNTLANYKVAADLPRALYINKIGVAARVLPMGVNIDGSMQAPVGIYDSGWYTGGPKPGEAGAMIIDGHASGPTREGLFANLDKLQNGDIIELEKGNGEKLNYKVVFTEIVPLDNVDMVKMSLPYGDNEQGLNLITCTGKWVKDENTYDHRVTVYAARVE